MHEKQVYYYYYYYYYYYLFVWHEYDLKGRNKLP